MEYPGYGVYPGEPTEEGVFRDIEPVHQFVTKVLGFSDEDVIVMGRSIGSGPSIEYCTRYPAGGLITISPFTSILDAANFNFGILAKSLLKQRFDNLSKIEHIKVPCLFIHGKDDKVVPSSQSEQLYKKCSKSAEILIFQGMTHHLFDVVECIAIPGIRFLEKIVASWQRPDAVITLPHYLFKMPETAKEQIEGWINKKYDHKTAQNHFS